MDSFIKVPNSRHQPMQDAHGRGICQADRQPWPCPEGMKESLFYAFEHPGPPSPMCLCGHRQSHHSSPLTGEACWAQGCCCLQFKEKV
jgi:hypothetical protein